MEEQKSLIRLVKKVSMFFGVNFSNQSRHSTFSIISLQVFFLFVSLYFAPAVYAPFKKISIMLILYIFQAAVPLFIEIAANVEVFKHKKLEFKICRKFEKIENFLKLDFDPEIKNEMNFVFFCFVAKILIIFLVRILKIRFAGIELSLHTMIPEAVCSVANYSFTFYVDVLYIYMKKYSQLMKQSQIIQLNISDDYLKFFKLSEMICKRFSLSVLLNVTINFILLTIDFYWIFIRLLFNHLKLEGLLIFSMV